jgi:hypothetical protein
MRKAKLFDNKFILLLAFIPALLAGCLNTQGTLEIKGKVTDEMTGTGIPRKNIIVHGLVYTNDKMEHVEVGQFSTQDSGCFSYSFTKVKDARYYDFSMVGDSNYVYMNRTLGLMELEQNAKFLSFTLSKLVDLTIKIYRKSKSPARDTLRMIWESDEVYGLSLFPHKIYNFGGTTDPVGLTSGDDLMWVGGKVNSTVTTKVFADKKTEISWELFRNGRRKEFTDTITCRRDFANTVYFAY